MAEEAPSVDDKWREEKGGSRGSGIMGGEKVMLSEIKDKGGKEENKKRRRNKEVKLRLRRWRS